MNRLRIILKENETLHEMLLGVLVSNFAILIIGLIAFSDKKSATLGVVIGTVLATFYIIHMAVTIDDALCLDEKGAASELRKNMLIRYVIVCAVIALVSYFEVGNPVLCIFSCLTIKLGAYLQPVMHKILKRSYVACEDTATGGSESGGKISE